MNKFKVLLVGLLVIGGIVSAALLSGWASHKAPQLTTESTASTVALPSASSESPLNDLSSRVVQFETVYRGFDWSNPGVREQQLTGLFLPETLSSVMQAEQQGTAREARLKSQTTQTVTSVGIVTGEVDSDLAETTATVTIRKTQAGIDPFEYTIESKTSWVFDGNIWLVYTVDPL